MNVLGRPAVSGTPAIQPRGLLKVEQGCLFRYVQCPACPAEIICQPLPQSRLQIAALFLCRLYVVVTERLKVRSFRVLVELYHRLPALEGEAGYKPFRSQFFLFGNETGRDSRFM